MKRILARLTVSLVVLGGGIGAGALQRAFAEGDPLQPPDVPRTEGVAPADAQPPELLRDERDAVPRTAPPPEPQPPRPAAPPTVTAGESPPARDVVTARPALGVTFVQGPRLRVRDVIPDSAADRIGLRHGDVIITLNGERFPSTDHFLTAVAAADFNHDHEIVFVREGQRHIGTFHFDPWDAVYPDTHTITAFRPAFDDETVADITDVTTVAATGCHPWGAHPHYFGSVYAGPYFYAPYAGPVYYGPAFYWGYGVPYYAPWWPYYSAAYAGPAYVGWQWW